MIYPITSDADRSGALNYLAEHLRGMTLYDCIPKAVVGRVASNLYYVASPGKPDNQNYRYGWGSTSAESLDWLVSEIVAYLLEENGTLCIIEDICQRRSDPDLTSGAPGPIWYCRDRVFWPITREMADSDVVRRALAWEPLGVSI